VKPDATKGLSLLFRTNFIEKKKWDIAFFLNFCHFISEIAVDEND